MSFVCPECAAPGSLGITLAIELPPDRDSDEIALQVVRCSRCGFRGAATYEESRRGSLDSDAWRHQGHRLGDDEMQALTEGIAACPEPGNRGCRCASHRSLGATDETGRWTGVAGAAGSFPMRVER